jgi:hypothetical protein
VNVSFVSSSGFIVDAFNPVGSPNPRVNPFHIGALPSRPPAGFPEATTRGEVLSHIFGEYKAAADLGGFTNETYRLSHYLAGMDAQDAYRLGIGQQQKVKAASFYASRGTLTIPYSGGAYTVLRLSFWGSLLSEFH